MPNGPHKPFVGAEGFVDSPSPIHTSDSEETYDNKVLWRGVAYKVLRQWLRYISVVRVQRLQVVLSRLQLLHERIRDTVPVSQLVAQYLAAPAPRLHHQAVP